MWRYGVHFRTCILLEQLRQNPRLESELDAAFKDSTFRGVSLSELIRTAHVASWIIQDDEGRYHVTDIGSELIDVESPTMRMRRQLERFIELLKPEWAILAVHGRGHLLNYVDLNVRQCFVEAGLTEGHSIDIVEWWDRLAAKNRVSSTHVKTEIGRRGERLSYELEYERTGAGPNWIALENSDAGFDLISQVSEKDSSRLVIEVKTSTRKWTKAVFYLSRHEWDVLSSQPFALLHLWCLHDDVPRHASLTIGQLAEHIASDSGNGKWMSISCPFIDDP